VLGGGGHGEGGSLKKGKAGGERGRPGGDLLGKGEENGGALSVTVSLCLCRGLKAAASVREELIMKTTNSFLEPKRRSREPRDGKGKPKKGQTKGLGGTP